MIPEFGAGRTVLVVEDEAGIRDLVAEVLERAGFRVLTARNGEQALLLVEEDCRALSLLLTDLILPGFNGLELAKRLRVRRPDLRVLVISGYSESTMTQQGIVLSGVDLLEKPFTTAILIDRVRQLLDADQPAGSEGSA